MKMNKVEFVQHMQLRTKDFVLRSIRLFRSLPRTEEARIIGRQFLRSSTSVGSNYRAVCRARSQAEYFAKLSIVVEETDESLFWLEILVEAEIMAGTKLGSLMNEAAELLAIFSTARKNTPNDKRR
ncbi:four helix bundle protein [Spirosoma endbachense]|uniref:Four helix bundle protein n=1 Tax=Spirosoma endbachense TaxID=2666025 RepID=A0A6P1VTZ1_9BACT|nr:four helix bundle protein [Spirosoma endbachense]QHV95868.1 four helix bundle protein [Spirosoma endbachense]